MDRKEIYKIWAPRDCKWSTWVRPVPFVGIDSSYQNHEWIDYTIPTIRYLTGYQSDTVIILDIDGIDSIKEGIALAKLGYCPVPIFNGTNPPQGTKGTTDNQRIEPVLVWGAQELQKIKRVNHAAPVFLLDANRLNRYKVNPSIFDNSWDIYPQDIPSPHYFLKQGITKIIVRGNQLHPDLSKVLYKYQKNYIQILFTNGYEEPKIAKIKKPKKVEL